MVYHATYIPLTRTCQTWQTSPERWAGTRLLSVLSLLLPTTFRDDFTPSGFSGLTLEDSWHWQFFCFLRRVQFLQEDLWKLIAFLRWTINYKDCFCVFQSRDVYSLVYDHYQAHPPSQYHLRFYNQKQKIKNIVIAKTIIRTIDNIQ